MSIVTKTGDKGTTGLFGGKRVPKHNARIEAYGTVDELNAVLGMVIVDTELPPSAKEKLIALQHLLFRLGADLATPMETKEKVKRMDIEHITQLETWVNDIESSLPPQTSFILPGGSAPSAHLHLARTVCRRAERKVVQLGSIEDINTHALVFLNRLSDYLFVLARKVNAELGVKDSKVEY
jgi:cob(I)alamin adenosyltransferase